MPEFRRGPARTLNAPEIKLDAIQPTLPLTHAVLVMVDDTGTSDVRFARSSLRPPWFTGCLRLLDQLSIPRDHRRFLVKRNNNTLFAIPEAETPSWENLQQVFREVAAAARAADGTVLLLFAGRHDEQTNELFLPTGGRSGRSSIPIDDLKALLERELSDRGALVLFDSFGFPNGAPIDDIALRDADRIGVPSGGEPSTLKRLPATWSLTPAPSVDAALLADYALSPLPVSWQVGSDHYLYANGTSPVSLSTQRTDMDAPLSASLFLLSTQSSIDVALKADHLFGLIVAVADSAGFVTESWTTQRDVGLPGVFYVHRVQPEPPKGEPESWPLVGALSATPSLSDVVDEQEGSGGAPAYTLNLDKLRQALGPNTTLSYVWSGFCPTDRRPRAPEAWYKVEGGGRIAYCTGTADRPNFNRSSWWSASDAPLDGSLLTFTRLKATVRLPLLNHTSMELP